MSFSIAFKDAPDQPWVEQNLMTLQSSFEGQLHVMCAASIAHVLA